MKNFFSKAKPYLILNAIILAIFTIFYAVFGVFPFGSGTLAHYDELSQVIPMSSYVFNFLEGKFPLFFSTVNGLGSNTFGTLAYFIFSPFNFILLLFGRSGMIYGFNLLFVIKLMLVASVSMWFAKKHFKDFDLLRLLIVSLSYAFCGFMFMMFTFFSFVDYLIAMPLLVESFIYLKEKKKILPLTLVLAFMMINCFGVGCFVMLYLFVIFSAYVYICIEKGERKVIVVKTICALLCAIGLAMPLLLPSFVSFLNASRNSGLSNFISINEKALPSKLAVEITEFFPFIFSIIYLLKCDKKDKFNNFLLVCEILTFILIVFDLSLKAFNMGSILGYYSRFGFVSAFLTFILTCKSLDTYFKFDEKGPKFSMLYIGVGILCLVYIFTCIIFFGAVTDTLASQVCFWPILAFLVLESLILAIPFFISYSYKKEIKGGFIVITFVIILCSICGSCLNYFPGGVVDTKGHGTMASFSKYIDSHDRVKIRDTGYLSMGVGNAGFSSCNIFSSLAEKEGIDSLKDIGYTTNINNASTYSGTLLSDMVVGTKYYIYPYEREESYLKLIASENGYYLYQNLLYTNAILTLKKEIEFTNDPIKNQQLIFEAFGGTGTILREVKPDLTYTDCELVDGKVVATSKTNIGTITINYDNLDGKLLYAYYKKTDKIRHLEVDSCELGNKMLLEMNRKDGKMSIEIYESLDIDTLKFYLLDLSKIGSIFSNNSNFRQEYNKFLGNIHLSGNSTVVLPYANLKGYSVKVNGNDVDFSNKFSQFMTLDLKAGENIIEITFNNPIYKYILIGLLVAGVLVTIGIVFNKIASKISAKLVDILLFSLAIIITLGFIIVPCGANFYALIKHLFL